ncbi:HipA domain-containing protein [Gemmiger formicilis]|uniref:HipA domain-containing protein n=1 Tax=Gemmiger formicilis TaxID=745368 RepID=UPI00195BFD71|nr:HipA domain-containing protein [Gemmiger formicilis]MBM6898382.1 HipA domain-containing protein [Gemmiger formicilis]
MNLNGKFYSGKDEKYGVTWHGKDYILKPARNEQKEIKIYAEYAASIVYRQLGWPVQNVVITRWQGIPSILVEDFLEKSDYFLPFGSMIEENYDADHADVSYSYENIVKILFAYPGIAQPCEALKWFWKLYLVDYLISAGGRNASNWGFIGHRGQLFPAPAFDNSSSFYYKLYSGMPFTGVGDPPVPRMSFRGEKKPRIAIISSCQFPLCNLAAQYVIDQFSLQQIAEELRSSAVPKQIVENWFLKILCDNFTQLKQRWHSENR